MLGNWSRYHTQLKMALCIKGVANSTSKTLGLAKFSRISRVSHSRFFSGFVRLAVSFFIRRCRGVSIFCEAKGLEDVFSSLDIECH